MEKKAPKLGFMAITVAAIFFAALLFFQVDAQAGAKVVPIEGMGYNVDFTIKDNLKSLVSKHVYVTLESGSSFAGFLKAVGNNCIHLEKLNGKEFFDALIRIEDITAIEAKFRDFER